MPQPYTLNHDVDFSPEAILKRPALATHIAIMNSMWSRLDLWLSIIVVKAAVTTQLKVLESQKHLPIDAVKTALIWQTANIAARLYLSLSGSAAKDAVLREILGEKALSEFEPLFKRVRSVRKQRNRIAHGICGVVAEIPDGLIIQDLEDSVMAAMSLQRQPSFIYKEHDFLELGKEISSLNRSLDSFQASEWKELPSPGAPPSAAAPGQQQNPPESPKTAP